MTTPTPLEQACAQLFRLQSEHEHKLDALESAKRMLHENIAEITKTLVTARQRCLSQLDSLDSMSSDEDSSYRNALSELFAPLLPLTVWTIEAIPVDPKYLRHSVGTFSTEAKALACLPPDRKYFKIIDWKPKGGRIEYDLCVATRLIETVSHDLEKLDQVPEQFGLLRRHDDDDDENK